MNEEQFKKLLAEHDILLTEKQEKQFRRYFELLQIWNERLNLTTIIQKEDVYEKHFYDCLTLSFVNDLNGKTLCDVGTGAGFPSIPLKIAFPDMKLTIIDPLSKRMDFLKIVIKELDLKDVEILYLRAEDASKKYPEKFDVVTARAVARLNILVEIVAQMVKVNGLFIAMKGQKGQEELEEAKNALNICNMSLIKQTNIEPSINYYFKKNKSISSKYPRNYGQIKKKPL